MVELAVVVLLELELVAAFELELALDDDAVVDKLNASEYAQYCLAPFAVLVVNRYQVLP